MLVYITFQLATHHERIEKQIMTQNLRSNFTTTTPNHIHKVQSALTCPTPVRGGACTELCDEFLRLLPADGTVLDLGCGSGRDSKYFLSHGREVISVDGSKELCRLAGEFLRHSGRKALHRF